MAEVYKLVHPVKYCNDYFSRNIRPDGREFKEQRGIQVSVKCIKTADASALVKCGNTTVVCGIQLELATPKAEEPNNGFLVTNLELPALCSAKFKPGPPSDHAQAVNNLVTDIVLNSKCVDLKDLCIVPDKLAWVLYCDMICVNNDGSVLDTCVIALMASLKTLLLPKVYYDDETEEIKVDTNSTTRLELHSLPIPLSFVVYKLNESNIVLADPTAYEEEICGGSSTNLIICYNSVLLCSIQKFGGSNLSKDCYDDALKTAKERAEIVEKVIDLCIQDSENVPINE